MGSDFTYNDLLTTTLEEFNYTLLGEKRINGHDCYVIEVQGKTKETKKKYGYSRELHFIRKSDFALMKVIFYDLAGDLLKEFTVNEVRKLGKYLYPSNVRMENIQTRHTSEIIFDELGIPDDISDRYFTQRYLQNR
jgi:negative regulator of sigma E activity